jgi:peptidyl-prolyl cis-trans isomerase B (cyclophilin B)
VQSNRFEGDPTMRRLALFALPVVLAGLLLPAVAAEQKKQRKQYDKEPEMKIDTNKIYIARIQTSAGPIVAELWPKKAPHTVNSFVFLAREGFYDGTIFHRVIPGFMLQGGDPEGKGTGGPGYHLKAEFNDTKHTRGVLSMARAADPDSAGSQFFIMHGDAPHLDNKYTAFGKVIEGMETVDKIARIPTDANDRPSRPPVIQSIKIEEKDAGAGEKKQ